MAATPIAISETGSEPLSSTVKEGKFLGLGKARSSDGRTFSAVLKQLLAQSGKALSSGNEGVKLPYRIKNNLIDGHKLDRSKLSIGSDDFDVRGRSKYVSGDGSRIWGAPDMLGNEAGLTANETAQLLGAADFGNREKNDETPLIRGMPEGRGGDNLTSIAPRVVVQDKRMEVAKAAFVSRARRLEHYSNSVGEDVDEGEFKLENRPVRADMEIEIRPRFEGRDSPRSAAMEFARRLDGQVGNEIVRQIRIVLSRDSAGELRIDLKPDNLGRMRVEIQLEDNHISGKFFVESAAAREVIKGALDGLQTKLLESGFGSADLEMASDDASLNFGFNSGDSRDQRMEAPELENPTPVNAFTELDDNHVNLVV